MSDHTDRNNNDNEGGKRGILIDDKLKELIVSIVSETVSKSLKETMSILVEEIKSEIKSGISNVNSSQELKKAGKSSLNNLNNDLFRTIKINRQRIIEGKLLSLIKEEGMLLSDLKFLVVNQLKYCSKASFYRYVEDLRKKDSVLTKGEGKRNFIFKNVKNIMR